ncbi:MAG TPA: class I SAM-dependent methyltransferase [Chitinispirillaceae bacterium]|nr:class I SAM-dependent methyltransferase [Chitinispirillaceae bacterium]
MTLFKKRWILAQQSEKSWWQEQIDAIDFNYFKKFADNLLIEINGIVPISSQTRILEIGSGPAGILTYLPSNHRFAIDPLEHFYGIKSRCKEIRDPQVKYVSGQGEFLPYSDNSFDFLIIDNILDHCENIDAVFSEMKRVLRADGVIYLRNFTHTQWGMLLANLLEVFKIDRGHPYHFRESDLLKLFNTHKFKILLLKKRGFFKHFYNLLSAWKISHFLRAISFSQADKMMFLLSNNKS